MTAYADSDDFKAAFGELEYNQLTDKDQTGTPDTTGFNAAIALASEMIDSAISGRYVVPLALPTSALILQICLDIARYYLYDDAPTDAVYKRYEQAVELLEKIRLGKLLLTDATLVDPATIGKSKTVVTGSDAFFTDDYLSKML